MRPLKGNALMFGSRTEVDMHNFTFENIVLGSGKKARGTTYTHATEDPPAWRGHPGGGCSVTPPAPPCDGTPLIYADMRFTSLTMPSIPPKTGCNWVGVDGQRKHYCRHIQEHQH